MRRTLKDAKLCVQHAAVSTHRSGHSAKRHVGDESQHYRLEGPRTSSVTFVPDTDSAIESITRLTPAHTWSA